MIELVIPGQTPAQKNGKSVGRTKSGRTFVASNPIVKDWQKKTLQYLNETLSDKFRPENPRIIIDYKFFVQDNRPRDTDNMIASINDSLQDALADTVVVRGKKKLQRGTGFIVGDNWQVLKLGFSDVEINKENPHAVIQLYAWDEWPGHNIPR